MKSPFFGRQPNVVHDFLALRDLRRRLETAETCEDYISVLADIERWLPIDATAVDFSIFSVLPTTFEPAAKWRDQLKYDLVARLHANIASRPWALWFRGQDREYLSADLVASAEGGVCPWRSFRDASLVPSIFRTLARKVAEANWREVGNYLLDTGAFAVFIDERLRIPAYVLRDVEPEPVLGKQFGAPWTITHSDTEEPPHDYHITFRALQKMFFFQHYGLSSPVLDITRDLDVALFFANNRLDGRTYFPVGDDPARVIYIMVLESDLDQFTNSEALCEHFQMLRPLREKCGLISGATAIMTELLCAVRFRACSIGRTHKARRIFAHVSLSCTGRR